MNIENTINKEEIKLMLIIMQDWKKEIDQLAENRISTKYSRLQDSMNQMIGFLLERTGDQETVESDKPKCNHKRIYNYMDLNEMKWFNICLDCKEKMEVRK